MFGEGEESAVVGAARRRLLEWKKSEGRPSRCLDSIGGQGECQAQAQAQRARGGLMETQKALVCLSACVDAAAAQQALGSRAATLGTSIAICD